MLPNLIILLFIVALGGMSAWLLRRAWRSKRPLVKWPGSLLSGFLTLLLVLVSALVAVGMVRAYAPRGNPVVEITVDRTPERVARGEQIANVICAACHSTNKRTPLTGGKNLSEDVGMPLGNLTPANLTPAARINGWSDGEVRRAIREGADPGRRRLAVMSSQTFHQLGEEDVQSIIAFLRSQPSVENETPRENLSVLSMVFLALKFIPSPAVPPAESPLAPPKAATAEYGGYITRYLDCIACHGKDLHGGSGGLFPKGPTLQVVKVWTQEQFFTTLRTGVNPAGHKLDPDEMPWEYFGRMDDEELGAVYAYLKGVP